MTEEDQKEKIYTCEACGIRFGSMRWLDTGKVVEKPISATCWVCEGPVIAQEVVNG